MHVCMCVCVYRERERERVRENLEISAINAKLHDFTIKLAHIFNIYRSFVSF